MTGKEIRKLRRSLDLTQKQIATMFGVTIACICQMECDTRIGKQRKAVEAKLLELTKQAA